MIGHRHIYLLLGFLLFTCQSYAQVAADTLKPVKVKGDKRRTISSDDRLKYYTPGQKVVTVDSQTLELYRYQSMANLLAQQVPVFVKSYGINSLATLNFRGSSAAQSQVYWNGVPLQNAALGISDVSLMPVSLMNKVNVVYGSSAAMFGSGNVGGALLVESETPDFSDQPEYQQSVSGGVGSFHQYQLALKSSITSKRFTATANIIGQTARNNYPYMKNGETQRMTNAAMQSGVGMLQTNYKLNSRNTLGLKGWYQQYYREVPPALFEQSSVKNQRDEALRLLADWDRRGNKSSEYVKLSYTRDYMRYEDSAVLLTSENVTNQFFGEAGYTCQINDDHRVKIFTPVQITWMQRVLVGDIKTQNKAALGIAYLSKYFQQRLQVSANLRSEVINDNSVLMPGVNVAYQLADWIQLKANVQKTYRVPTLNELYYVPGGNPKLKPEQGWAEDLGYEINFGNDKVSLLHEVFVYNRLIDNWIIWFGGAIWTPHNIAQVKSQGIEMSYKLNWQAADRTAIIIGVNGSYTHAVTVESDLPGDGSAGKQIPYTPRWQGQLNAGLKWKNFYFNYNYAYVGIRYITVDESLELLPYHIGNIQVLYTTAFNNFPLQISGTCNNIWNVDYQVVNARPMPGINWQLGLSIGYRQ